MATWIRNIELRLVDDWIKQNQTTHTGALIKGPTKGAADPREQCGVYEMQTSKGETTCSSSPAA